MPLSKANLIVRNAALTLSALSLFVGCTTTPKRVEASPAPTPPATTIALASPIALATTLAAPDAPTSAPSDVIAIAGEVSITSDQLMKPLIESYGLSMLMQLIKLEWVEAEASKLNISITSEQIAFETTRSLHQVFKDASEEDYPQLLEKLLSDGKLTRAEFDIAMRTNALLRQLALPQIRGKVTEENVREAFEVLYGARREVRHIAVRNLPDIVEAQRRLKSGEAFEVVARTMSVNATSRAIGGKLPPFASNNTSLNKAFVQAAFALEKEGDVSEPVQADEEYHLIKLEKKLEPRAVRYDDVRLSVRSDLENRIADEVMKATLDRIGQRVLREIKFNDPVLREQFDRRLKQANSKGASDQLRNDLNRSSTAPRDDAPRLSPRPLMENAATTQPSAPR